MKRKFQVRFLEGSPPAMGAGYSAQGPAGHLCGKPIPAPLKCHSAGRGTSVPTENTDACRRTDCASRTETATVVFSRATRRLSLGAFADRAKIGEAMFAHIQRRTVTPMQQAFRRGDRDAGIGTAAPRNSTE